VQATLVALLYCGVSRLLFIPLLALVACTRAPQGHPPRAEFLVSNADSSFWVTADTRGIRMRGAPLILARVDGRFHELFVADDDRSYYDAVFVGQRLFRRDLISGDSAELLSDGEVAAMTERFAREHPEERPLAAEEGGADQPRTSAVAELRVVDVHGPFASYEHITDIDITGGASRHAAHRGVIDLRSGDELTVGDLFGGAEESRVVARAEKAWQAVRDSLQSQGGPRREATASALDHFAFNAGSFTVGAQDRVPQVHFAVPGSGGGAGGLTLPLPPQPVRAPAWWSDVSEGLPLGRASMLRWPRERFELVARNDSTGGDRATLALRDGAHEWPVGVVRGPVRRIFWLDSPGISREGRQALLRAFDAASMYSMETRIVQAPSRREPSALVRAAARRTHPGTARRARGLLDQKRRSL
jgi:hypothetical protein